MATQQYYQPMGYTYHAPSKAPASTALYPISRVPDSPPDYSDVRTITGSRSSDGLTFSSSSRSSESSSASYSGVDVVDLLRNRMQDAFDPTPLDKSLARQVQTSGQLNAKQQELLELQALAQRRLKTVRIDFQEGLRVARETKCDLEWTQKRVNALKAKAAMVHPEEYGRSSKKYAYDEY